MTREEFFSRVKGDYPNYDFSNSVFMNIQTPIEVICNIHGLFSILPSNMLYKHEGCKFCGIENMAKSKSLTKQEFIKRANRVFKGIYDYSLTNYKNNKTKIKIICKKCGTVFEQYPCNHLKGYGCPKCKKAE
jgi:protein-arginine kinase activator protein McsA